MGTRINGSMMAQFNQQTVSLVGELVDPATLLSCDGTRIQLVGFPAIPAPTKYVEVIAKCDVPNRLTFEDAATHCVVPLGDALDAGLVQQAIQLMHHEKLQACFKRTA